MLLAISSLLFWFILFLLLYLLLLGLLFRVRHRLFINPSPSYIYFLWGKLEFLVDTPFEFIVFFYLGFSRAILLSLNNLSLVFLFAGFMCLISYLFINKIAAVQPFYSIILFIENPWFDYIIFFYILQLYLVVLFFYLILLLSVALRLCIG